MSVCRSVSSLSDFEFVRLSSGRLSDSARLSDDLLRSAKYSELLSIIQDHHARLSTLAQNDSLSTKTMHHMAPITSQ